MSEFRATRWLRRVAAGFAATLLLLPGTRTSGADSSATPAGSDKSAGTAHDSAAGQSDATAAARAAMVATIREYSSLGPHTIGPTVQDAMTRTPRHEFVPESMRARAYADAPLPIGSGQTISQPYIVALMTELASVDADDVVLEIGTGSGYQAAVLSPLVKAVFTIEIVEPLGRQAEQTLRRLGYSNVQVRVGDGYKGWPEHAPFDAILITAAPEAIPEPLVAQLKPGGRLVVPVGSAGGAQELTVLEKQQDGSTKTRSVLPVRFVPLTRSPEAAPPR